MSHLWPLLPPLPSSPCVRPAPLLKKWVREESRAALMSFLSQPVQAQGPKMDSSWGTLCLSRGPHDHRILWTCPAFLQDFLPGEGAGYWTHHSPRPAAVSGVSRWTPQRPWCVVVTPVSGLVESLLHSCFSLVVRVGWSEGGLEASAVLLLFWKCKVNRIIAYALGPARPSVLSTARRNVGSGG